MAYLNCIKGAFLGLVVLVFSSALASAESNSKTFVLKDGTVLQGEIVGSKLGEYTVQSPTLGRITVRKMNIASMKDVAQPAANQAADASAGDLQAVQAKIMADPGIMADIQAIANDPAIMALIADPAFMQAAQAKDMAALQSNPRMAQLMAHPRIKAIIQKIQAANGQ